MLKRENPPRPEVAVWSPGPCGPARIYKNRPKGAKKGHQSCLACFPANEVGQKVPLTLGCSLVLCARHRDPSFIASESGRRFLSAISSLYESLGLSSGRFGAALRTFVDRCANAHRHRRAAAPARLLRLARASAGRRAGLERRRQLRAGPGRGPRGATGPPRPHPQHPHRRRWWHDRRWLGPPLSAAELEGLARAA